MEQINTKLLILLESRNISDTALSKMSGVGRTTIYRMKKGKAKPEYETLKKVAAALGVEVNEII